MKITSHFRKDKMLRILKDNFLTIATFAGVVIGKLFVFHKFFVFKIVHIQLIYGLHT